MSRRIDYLELFNDSFERTVTPRGEVFYDAFYRRFLGTSERIADMFAQTEMSRQKRVLHESLVLMIAFYCDKVASPRLQQIARRHGPGGLGVEERDYQVWLESLLGTVAELDPRFGANTALAWRIVLAPGLAFMQHFDAGD